jgi:hypothetical protein
MHRSGGSVVDKKVRIPAVGHTESDDRDTTEHGFPPGLIGVDRGRCGQLLLSRQPGADRHSCRPCRAQTSGKVESGAKYVRRGAAQLQDPGEVNLRRALG